MVRQLYHDTPDITGYSLYGIFYGKVRHEGGVPFQDAKAQAAVNYLGARQEPSLSWPLVQNGAKKHLGKVAFVTKANETGCGWLSIL